MSKECDQANPEAVQVQQSGRHQLPPGVRGIDLGEMLMLFARDKLVLAARGAREHITMHIGSKSGELDFHKTYRTGKVERHQRLYSIPHSNFGPMLEELMPLASRAWSRIVRPLNLDELVAKRIAVVVGLLVGQTDLETVMKVRRGKLAFDLDKLASRVRVPEYLEELYDLADGQFFTLLAARRRGGPRIVGHGFAVTDCAGNHQLLWLPTRSIQAESRRIGRAVQLAATKYGQFYTADLRSA